MSEQSGSADAGTPATPAGTPAAESWTSSITNPETKGFAELRGWKSPEQAVESFRQLEKFQGLPPERLAKIPEAEDQAGWTEFNKKFGWAAPEKAEDYGLTAVEGFDAEFVTKAQSIFQKHNVPKDMALNAFKDIGAVLGELQEAHETGRTTQHNNDLAALKSEWGANYDGLIETAKRAAQEYMPKTGLNDADMDAIRDAIGSAKFDKLWAGIGSTMGEAAFVESGSTRANTGLMTPDAARARIDQLSNDKAWFDRKEAGGVKENTEWAQLKAILANATLAQR